MFQRLGLLIFLTSLNVYGFGVDVCFYAPDSGEPPIKNCLGVGRECRTSNLDKEQAITCRLKSLYDGVSGLSENGKTILGARNLLHSDSTYLMAQLIGFSPWQAYQMMVYSEATDQTEYTAFDQKGSQILSDDEIKQCKANWTNGAARECLIITPEVGGIYKFNFPAGGTLLHLHALFAPNGKIPHIPDFPTDYFSSINRDYENLLTNFRAWVFNERSDACAAGITKDMSYPESLISPCTQSAATLKSPMNLFSLNLSKLTIHFVTQLGTLILEEPDQNHVSKPILANDESFQAYITPHEVAFAKMGIFVHVLADRYSHHMCTDNSYFYPIDDDNYTSIYSATDCAQGSHFLWHVWEQGTNQADSNLNIKHQTMRPALEAVYDQLIAYAKYKNIAINQTTNKQALMDELIIVLQTFDSEERLQKMVQLMEKYKLLPLPGHGSAADYSIDKWLDMAGA